MFPVQTYIDELIDGLNDAFEHELMHIVYIYMDELQDEVCIDY